MATVYSAELTEDRRDALQEMVNVAMGRAGSLMADHMRCFIHLSIPVISIVSTVKLSESLSPVADGMAIPDPVTGVRQGFYDSEDPAGIRGEAIVVYDAKAHLHLAQRLQVASEPTDQVERELLLEITNIITGACLNGIADQIGVQLDYSAPSIVAQRQQCGELLDPTQLPWDHCLRVQVHYSEDGGFGCNLFLLLTTPALEELFRHADQFLADLDA